MVLHFPTTPEMRFCSVGVSKLLGSRFISSSASHYLWEPEKLPLHLRQDLAHDPWATRIARDRPAVQEQPLKGCHRVLPIQPLKSANR